MPRGCRTGTDETCETTIQEIKKATGDVRFAVKNFTYANSVYSGMIRKRTRETDTPEVAPPRIRVVSFLCTAPRSFSRASTRRAQDRSKSRDTCRQLPCTMIDRWMCPAQDHTRRCAACAYRQLRTPHVPRCASSLVTPLSLSRRQLIRRRLENT